MWICDYLKIENLYENDIKNCSFQILGIDGNFQQVKSYTEI